MHCQSHWRPRCRIIPTNAILEDPEARRISNQLSDAEIELADVNERIATGCVASDDLFDQRADLIDEITKYRISLTPHKKLPLELLGKIFEYCVPDQVSLPPMRYAGPLVLCHIFSYWRRVALNTPALWNRIAVQFQFYSQIDPVDTLAIAKTWLDRSGVSVPLSISLWVDPYVQPQDACDWDPVQALITPYIHRCREIHLCVKADSLRKFWQLPGGCARNLEVFEVIGTKDLLERSWADAITVFESAHRLYSVAFRSAYGVLEGSQLSQLPYSQLTALEFHDTALECDACHAILRQCTNLIYCAIGVASCNPFKQIPANPDSIVIPNLRLLKLDLFMTDYSLFLRPLFLPALKDFEFSVQTALSCSAFISLCLRSSIELERVFVNTCVDIDGPNLEPLLRHMSSVVELDIPFQHSVDKSTLDMIIKGDLIPKLEVIDCCSLPVHIALDIITSRWSLDAGIAMRRNSSGVTVSRLQYAAVSMKSLDLSALARLQTFKDEGLLVDCLV